MKKYKILIIFIILFIGLSDLIPIEITSGLLLIISSLLFPLVMCALSIYNFTLFKNLSKSFVISGNIINTILLVIYIYIFVINLFLSIDGNYPEWKDERIYTDINGGTRVILQKKEISGSIYDWRLIKSKKLFANILFRNYVNKSELNGIWKIYSIHGKTTQIVEFQNGNIRKQNRRQD